MLLKYPLLLAMIMLFLPNSARPATPTTAAQVAGKLDLETLPLPKGAEIAGPRRIAELGYVIKKPTQEIFSFVDLQLTNRGWKQLPGAQDHDDCASVDYQLEGYTVHLSVFPQGPGVAHVVLTHMGNIAPEEMPVPSNVEKMYVFTNVAMWKSPDSVEEAVKACRKLMQTDGWSPYGGAGDTAYYRKNAMRVDVNVMSAPAQNNATVINITSKILSLELPAPSFADNFRYSDSTTTLGFDTDKSPQEVTDFYRSQLEPSGWQATTDRPVAIDWKQITLFSNAGQEMITIETHELEGRTRVNIDHQNASEVANDELLMKIATGEKAKYRNKKWLPVKVTITTGLKVEQLEDWALKILTPKGKAFATAEAIIKSQTAVGWTADNKKAPKPVIRSYRLTGQKRTVYLIAIDPPKLESWVAIVAVGGVKFEPVE